MHDDTDWPRIARYITGACSDEERRAIEAWLAEDPARRETVEAVRRIWESTKPEPDRWNTPAAWRELLRKEAATRPPAIVRPPRPRRQPIFASLRHEPRRRPVATAWAAAAVVVLALGTTLWFPADRGASTEAGSRAPLRTVATTPGQRLDLRMPDGTRVVLGVASTLRYPGDYGAARREVYLEGQAYFEVTHDEANPFVVHAGNAVARDLGTRFDVRAYRDDGPVEVVVAEGEVELAGLADSQAASSRRVVLTPGQLGRVDGGGAVTVRADVDLNQRLGWIDGRLVFKDARLREVLPQLSRWYDLEFRLADSALGERRLTGTFGDASPEFLQFLGLSLEARYEQQGRTITLAPSRGAR